MEPAVKRSADFLNNHQQKSDEYKCELENSVFVVAAIFQGDIYVHVRRYKDRYPTKDGVAMSPEEWDRVSQLLTEDSERKINSTTGKIMMKRFKNQSATLTSTTKGTSIALTSGTVANIRDR